ncbi:MerC domain-containing protein [Aureitalea marina]|uniref:MerC mercury resistance protein n=1 Tax=Aureitalea marina TaxID=930804 RepID=A0A2S7KPW8_9FLAO|nr:MerC domain-containing protein [Aureitalea marina]PQB04672.1 hypothetical protein BST85_07015 [Aureitalea marina]
MNIQQLDTKSDLVGAFASGLCMLHCLATPFLFTLPTAGHGEHAHPDNFWWGILDILFLVISAFAVYHSAKNTSKSWVKYAMTICWLGLAAIILNEKLSVVHIAEFAIYIPALALVTLHLYNQKYCQCQEENCCV